MIHQYKLGGFNIVLDVCSGGVHVVDEVAYDIIGLFETHSREEILEQVGASHPTVSRAELEECFDQVAALKEAGKLFARCGEGSVPPHCPYLQPELLLLLCQPGQIPR